MIDLIVYTSEPVNSLALKLLFQSAEDIALRPVVSDLQSLLEEVASAKPDVVLLSVDAGVDWGLLGKLRQEHPTSRLVLWMHETTPEVAYQAIEYGIRGILRKNLAPDLILKCVRKVHAGELWFEKTLTQTFLNGRPVKVSRREGELITLVSQGLKNKEIATVMDISEGTVKVYLSRLFGKIGVRDRFELALIGLRNSQNIGETAHAGIPALGNPVPSAGPLLAPVPRPVQSQSGRVLFARTGR